MNPTHQPRSSSVWKPCSFHSPPVFFSLSLCLSLSLSLSLFLSAFRRQVGCLFSWISFSPLSCARSPISHSHARGVPGMRVRRDTRFSRKDGRGGIISRSESSQVTSSSPHWGKCPSSLSLESSSTRDGKRMKIGRMRSSWFESEILVRREEGDDLIDKERKSGEHMTRTFLSRMGHRPRLDVQA